MGANEEAVQVELQRRQVAKEAAARDTASLLRSGWIAVVVGWFLPIFPVIGFIGLWLCGVAGLIISLIAMAKGNIGGGVKLLLGTILGGVAAVIIWVLVYGTAVAVFG